MTSRSPHRVRNWAASLALVLVAGATGFACSSPAASGPPEATATSGASLTATSDLRIRSPWPPYLPTIGNVQVDRSSVLGRIGPGFAGLGYEKGVLNQGFFAASNGPLVALFKRLGPGVLRIGGGGNNGVDINAWVPDATTDAPFQITHADVSALGEFLTATGWSALYGINMLANCAEGSEPTTPPPEGHCTRIDPSVAAAEALDVADTLGSSLYGFEIGNEPEDYAFMQQGGLLTYADFLSWWQTLYGAMHGAAPGAAFTGPVTSGGFGLSPGGTIEAYTVPFAQDEAAAIVLLTQHYYRADGLLPTSTLDELLTPDPLVVPALDALSAAATANHLPRGYAIAEANSFSSGGAPHISDSFGASLWVLDFLFTNAQHGSSGVSLFGGGFADGYTPIADDKQGQVCDTGTAGTCHLSADKDAGLAADPAVRPDYYGMFLFTQAGQGTVLASPVTFDFGKTPSFTAYAVGQSFAATSVVLVNKEPVTSVTAIVDVGDPLVTGDAAVTLLQGPSLDSTTGPFTVDGAPIQPDGTWTPTSTPPPVPVAAGQLVVEVPPASAMLVRTPRVLTRRCLNANECCIESGGSWDGARCE
jgi:hypothetical protein